MLKRQRLAFIGREQQQMLISGRRKLLTKPGKGAISSETPYRDDIIVTLTRYMLRKGISLNASNRKAAPAWKTWAAILPIN